jgi:hypothetical protein
MTVSRLARASRAALNDQLLDGGDDLGRSVAAGVGDFVEHGAVTLVADAGQHWDRQLADGAGQFVIVEPGQVVDCAATANDNDGVGLFLVETEALPAGHSPDQCLADLGSGPFALEAAVDDDEAAQVPALQSIGW